MTKFGMKYHSTVPHRDALGPLFAPVSGSHHVGPVPLAARGG